MSVVVAAGDAGELVTLGAEGAMWPTAISYGESGVKIQAVRGGGHVTLPDDRITESFLRFALGCIIGQNGRQLAQNAFLIQHFAVVLAEALSCVIGPEIEIVAAGSFANQADFAQSYGWAQPLG